MHVVLGLMDVTGTALTKCVACGTWDGWQRAKMKEIAAQRARQLQKEEEERSKEQKAKARAKLEELNRRHNAGLAGSGEEVDAEGVKASLEAEEGEELQAEESPAAEAEAVVQSSSSSGSTKRGVRNEHGKRERDKKANGRKAGLGEGAKAKANGSGGQGSAILPPPVAVASGGPLLTTPAAGAEAYGQQGSLQRESRHRGRPEKKQLVAKSEEGDRSVAMPTGGTFPDTPWSGANGGWSMDTPLAVAQETESATVSHPATSGTEGSGSLRKNKSNNRNGRNRQRPEAPAVMAESIQFGDIVSGIHIPAFHSMVGGEQGADAGASAFHVEVGKEGNVSLSGDALTGDEGSAVSTNGDASGKRMQRKSRGARRGLGRSDRGSQDQRTSEKSHGSDSMVWAPVRSPGGGGGNKGEGGQLSEQQQQQQKEESSSAQQQARAKRAEMERYTPKPLMKYQESADQAAVGGGQQQAAGAHSGSSQGGVPGGASAAEFPRGGSAGESKQASSADAKSNHEAKASESGTKGGKSQGSWRQRGSGSERVTEGAKDVGGGVNVSGSGHGDRDTLVIGRSRGPAGAKVRLVATRQHRIICLRCQQGLAVHPRQHLLRPRLPLQQQQQEEQE